MVYLPLCCSLVVLVVVTPYKLQGAKPYFYVSSAFLFKTRIISFQARKDATQLVANLQRQQVNSRLIASDYLEANFDLMDILVAG